jgi:hypothetical protein
MRVEAGGSSIYKALPRVFARLVRMSMMVDVLVVVVDMAGVIMIVAMVMHVAVYMNMRGRMVRMRSMRLAD